MANSIIQNEAPDWPYGAYVNYPDDRLENCKCIEPQDVLFIDVFYRAGALLWRSL